jgi:hypothetical protein
LKHIREIAWERFSINSAVVADINGRFIATLFYCTVMVPFGLLSALFMDPLHKRKPLDTAWLKREAAPVDMKSAKEQG